MSRCMIDSRLNLWVKRSPDILAKIIDIGIAMLINSNGILVGPNFQTSYYPY